MSNVSAEQFAKEVIKISSVFGFIKGIDAEVKDGIIAEIRIFIKENVFLDVFYNSDTSKTAFALIKYHKRIFGADNTGKWHYHPFEDPKEHKECDEKDIKWILEKIKDNLENI